MSIKRRTTKSSENKDENELYRKENTIHFYSEIDRKSWLDFDEILHNMNNDESVEEITLRISSCGGEMCYAFSIVSLIENSKKPIHGIVDNECSSAALFLLLACKTRKATRCSEFLMHEGSSEEELKTSELIKKYKAEMILEKESKDYILSKTNFRSKQYDTITNNGIVFYTDEAIQYGIISAVI